MKNILIINAYPYEESFSSGLQQAYKTGAISNGHALKEINLRDLSFNLNLEFGYRKFPEPESDILKLQDEISWSNHLVFIYPVWWGTYPALMKGMIDRRFPARVCIQVFLWQRTGKAAYRKVCTSFCKHG